MSDDELAAIRRKKLREFQRRIIGEEKPDTPSGDEILNRIFKGRAWEIFNIASYQFPDDMNKIKDVLVKLGSYGKLTEVTGEELYVFLRKVGLEVRLNTQINYASHGQLKSLEERMKEELRKT